MRSKRWGKIVSKIGTFQIRASNPRPHDRPQTYAKEPTTKFTASNIEIKENNLFKILLPYDVTLVSQHQKQLQMSTNPLPANKKKTTISKKKKNIQIKPLFVIFSKVWIHDPS